MKVSALAALCLLALVSSAYAECAWVVWSNIVVSGSDNWVPVQAAGSRNECGATADAQNRLEARVREQYIAAGRQKTTDVSYLCLPDTVDPRGPKGK